MNATYGLAMADVACVFEYALDHTDGLRYCKVGVAWQTKSTGH